MIIDISNVDKNSKQFGIGVIADLAFLIYREPCDDDIYMYYDTAFVLDENALIEGILKEGMTFQEAYDEVLKMRDDYMKDPENIDNEVTNTEGDKYHTINLDPQSSDNNINGKIRYDATLLLNKNNYGITTNHLDLTDCDELMALRGRIADMANDWYGGVVEKEVILKDIMSIFELNNIQIDISEYQKEKEVDIMIFNTLSYIDSIIIAIQHNMITDYMYNEEEEATEENAGC